MKFRTYCLLFIIEIAILALAARIQFTPGYMDAEYYWMTGQQIVSGRGFTGFTEPVIWNYLDHPATLPHPSNLYWMPLASMVGALGMLLARTVSFSGAQWIFIIMAALIPPLTAWMSYSFEQNPKSALLAGLCAIFSGFYLPRLVTTDTFALVMILGILFFQSLKKTVDQILAGGWKPVWPFACGLCCGLMGLSRAEGFIWLFFGVFGLGLIWFAQRKNPKLKDDRSLPPGSNHRSRIFTLINSMGLLAVGCLVSLGPWLIRNAVVTGNLFSAGGSVSLWLTNYNQLFAFHPETLTIQHWLASGWDSILQARLEALAWNLQSTLAIQMEIILLPLAVWGLWAMRKDVRVQVGTAAWVCLLLIMTIVFPFSGSRGGWFHSAAAVQPLFWAVAPIGLLQLVGWGKRHREWRELEVFSVFSGVVCVICVAVTAVFYQRVVINGNIAEPTWNDTYQDAAHLGEVLKNYGADETSVVMVNDPPGFYVATGFSAIVIPSDGLAALEEAAAQFGADYLVIDENTVPELQTLYLDPKNTGCLVYLASDDNTRIYEVDGADQK